MIEEVVEEPHRMNELEYFEYRLKDGIENGANFRVPIDWQKYGPLFMELYKVAREHIKAGYLTSEPLETVAKKLRQQMEWDLNR